VFNATYGILDNLDVSIAIPIIRLQMDVRGVATINHIGTTPQQGIHRFADGSDTLTVNASDEATGIGDIVLRGKYNFLRLKPVSLAAGLDLRLPTGDEDNLLGLGTTRVRPFFVASATTPWGIAPHVNVGFDLGDTSKLDDEFFYKVGFDWAATKWATFAFDVLGRYIIDNSRLQPNGQPADNNIVDASIGFKVNVWQNLLILANVLVPLNSTGLRADAVPFVGVEWTF